eukprot:4242615-Alexandrium_andersonii.AAC.1
MPRPAQAISVFKQRHGQLAQVLAQRPELSKHGLAHHVAAAPITKLKLGNTAAHGRSNQDNAGLIF